MKNEHYIPKKDKDGNVILNLDGSAVLELSSQEDIKEIALTDVEKKNEQFLELSKTDWYIVRKIETGIEVPSHIIEERQAIRDKYL